MIRKTLFILGMTGIPAMASAAPCVDIADPTERLACYDDAQRCAAIREDDIRLQCFDREYAGRTTAATTGTDQTAGTGSATAANGEAASGSRQTGSRQTGSRQTGSRQTERPARQTVRPEPDSEYSRPPAPPSAPAPVPNEENFGRPASAEVDSIAGTIVETQTDARGVDYFRLANGQVWRETRDHKVVIEEGQSIRIEKGALNSYNLKSDTINKLVKVRRVN